MMSSSSVRKFTQSVVMMLVYVLHTITVLCQDNRRHLDEVVLFEVGLQDRVFDSCEYEPNVFSV